MGRLPLMSTPDRLGVVYEVRLGDTLTKIITETNQMSFADIGPLVEQVREDNPHITNANRIWPGQLIFVRFNSSVGKPLPAATKADVVAASESFSALSVGERATARMLSPIVSGPASAARVFTDSFKDTIARNSIVIDNIIADYQIYKAGQITRNQYSYRRTKHLSSWKSKTGPFGVIALGGKEASKSFRMQAGRTQAPTAPLLAQQQNLKKAANLAKRGGNVLTAVNLSVACRDIAHQPDRIKKNEILIETTGSMMGSVTAGAMIALAVTPVGWVAILAFAATGALIGYGAGKASVAVYDLWGNQYDVVEVLQVESVCNTEVFRW